MRIVLLLLALLPFAGDASAGVLRVRPAFGLAPLDRGLSLWFVGEKTWVGGELDRLELSWDEEIIPDPYREYAWPEPPWDAVNHLTRRIRWSVTIKRLLSQAPVAPFVYLRLYVGLTHAEWEHYYHDNWSDVGPELGIGILWHPLKRASVAVRQGWAWEENDKRRPVDRYYIDDRHTTVIRLQETRLLVLYHF